MINQIKTVLLLGILFTLFLGIGFLFGGTAGLTIGFILAFVINFISYWFSDKIVLFMYGAKEVKEKDYKSLFNLVKDVSRDASLPMPKVYVMQNETPNAFATGRSPKHSAVAVTTGIMNLLTIKELKGVIAHEMAHIKNRDILISSIAAVIAGAISYVAMIARFGALFGSGDDREGGVASLVYVLVLAILAPIIAMIVQFAISRYREYLADSTGAFIINDSNSLADALEKLDKGVKVHPMKKGNPATAHMFIVNPFSGGAILNLFSTHPPLCERVKRLRIMKI
jgi:heat shock protein HtpX